MLSLMDEIFCFQCFCTEKYEKCVRLDKNLSINAAPQGREYKKKRLLCRNRPGHQATGPPDTRAPSLGVRPLIFFILHVHSKKLM